MANRRLAPQDHEWINRDRPIRFRFEGRDYEGYDGDTLSSALWANGVRMLGRSFKYHRPRGIFSHAGHDANVMVEDRARTNLRGDTLAIADGLDVWAVNTRDSLQHDHMAIAERFSALMPVGFYYKAFHTPARLFPLYERILRKVAGLGQIRASQTTSPTPKQYDFCDLLIVGSGPAGLSAAINAAQHGVQTVVVDEQPNAGGTLAYQWNREPKAEAIRSKLLAKAASLTNLEIRTLTQAGGYYEDHWIALVDGRCLTKMRAKAVVVASGCFEQPAVFGNNDLPGVMLGSAAQRLIHLFAIKPFERAVVLAANRDGYRLALDLLEAGVEVPVLADLRPEGEPGELGKRAADQGIAIRQGFTIYEAIPSRGGRGIAGVKLCRLDRQGQPESSPSSWVDCDGAVMSVGWAPAAGLLYQAGGHFQYCEQSHQFIPATLPMGVFAAGRIRGVFDLADQLADGARCGLAAASYLGRFEGPLPPTVEPIGPPASHPYPIYAHAKKKNFVDLDEDLHLTDFVHAVQEGYDNIELMKRYTTVGMGPSQGKLANMNAIRILARLTAKTIEETGSTTSRPFHQPVPMSHLAGRCFHPHRYTPMHNWHQQMGAKFFDVGAWKRPEYYATSAGHAEEAILTEAQNVRQRIGLIDVGTLGKLEVCGPDAAAFLERHYTGRFTKLPVGKLRYGLACDETGVIIDDGVISRVADDRFFVTATTSGADSVYQQWQRNALLWDMSVVLINVTGQYAAMNLAGPQSRHVLKPLTEIDLDPQAFPYMALREGKVAGVAARVLRVGFVGELGYEIHVPAAYGTHVWETLMSAGEPEGIMPFGVEAQRLLRLEKGHVIVGQDTDALTTPHEAGMEWTISAAKPFFVGQRSLRIHHRQPLRRRLVGLSFEQGYTGRLPEECHLVIDRGHIAGRVTSMAKRSTLGHALGMGFVRPDLAEPGTTVTIRVDGNQTVAAQVASIPFYDPQNKRQKP